MCHPVVFNTFLSYFSSSCRKCMFFFPFSRIQLRRHEQRPAGGDLLPEQELPRERHRPGDLPLHGEDQGQLHLPAQVKYRVIHLAVDWVGLTWILGVPLSDQFCMGWWEFGRSGWANGQEGGTPKSKSTQPRYKTRWITLYKKEDKQRRTMIFILSPTGSISWSSRWIPGPSLANRATRTAWRSSAPACWTWAWGGSAVETLARDESRWN